MAEKGKSFFKSFMDSLTLSRRNTGHRQTSPPPATEDLGLKTLRQVYSQYALIESPYDREKQLFKILPLFCKNCAKFHRAELVTKFPEVYDFAEEVSALFARQVSQLAGRDSGTARNGLILLKYFEQPTSSSSSSGAGGGAEEDDDSGEAAVESGFALLQAISVLCQGPEPLLNTMMGSKLSSILVKCIHLFLDLPPPSSGNRSRSGSSTNTPPASSPSPRPSPFSLQPSTSPQRSSPVTTLTPLTSSTPPSVTEQDVSGNLDAQGGGGVGGSEVAQRTALERLFRAVLSNLLRNSSAVLELLKGGELSLLFGAISSPCPPYNKLWRKAATDCLITICRHSLSADVISYIHNNGCILFCMRNVKMAVDRLPMEVVEIFSAIYCCLKDSADFSQVLLDDFSNSGGFRFLHDYLLHLERKKTPEAREAGRNMVLLIQKLSLVGFVNLEPMVSEGSPFQDPGFSVPVPAQDDSTVKNLAAFNVLQDAFVASHTSHLGCSICDAILGVFESDPANYFITEAMRTLSHFVEALTTKRDDVQVKVFRLLEFVMMELNYVPTAELTSIGLLLAQKDHPKTLSLALNFLLRLISHSDKYKDIFREVGILTMLVSALKSYVDELETRNTSITGVGVVLSSPSLPLEDVQGADEESIFLLMECLRATIEGTVANGQLFRDSEGTKKTLEMVHHKKPRRMALRLVTQLILLEDGSVDFNDLLNKLTICPQTAVVVKTEILQTVLGVFQLDSGKKDVFREVGGFHYLITVLATLCDSLAPHRKAPWGHVPRSEVLHLVQLVFTVMTSAMQDDPANKHFFDTNIRFDSFTAPLRLLGCFEKDIRAFQPRQGVGVSHHMTSSGSYTSFEAEFKTWVKPSGNLDPNSFVFSASEIFRFLRDMSLDIPSTQSVSLLDEKSRSIQAGAPPVTAQKQRTSTAQHLVHPGAVLCMIDLLAAVDVEQSSASHTLPPAIRVGVGPGGDLEMTDGSSHGGQSSEGSVRPVLKVTCPSSLELGGGEGGEGGSEQDLYSCYMPLEEAKNWCVFLQERVVSEVYSLATSERNQQALCQVGLPQRILHCCSPVLADEMHPLHQALERSFEKLSYQSLTPADFRSFLRLGNPLNCSINDITIDQLEERIKLADNKNTEYGEATPPLNEKDNDSAVAPSNTESCDQTETGSNADSTKPTNEATESDLKSTNQDAPYGGSLSLARIQSLVSMTTPRDAVQPGLYGSPSFVEFDQSIDGFGCLFLPSVFPQFQSEGERPSRVANLYQSVAVLTNQSAAAAGSPAQTTGVGVGERGFPPSNGLTLSAWVFFCRYARDESSPVNLLTLSQSVLTTSRSVAHYPCLRVLLQPWNQTVVVTTHLPRDQLDAIWEDLITKDIKTDEVVFECPQLFQLQSWHHVVMVINKNMRGRSKVTLFIDGTMVKTLKMPYLHVLHIPSSSHFLPYPTEATPFLINAHIGTHVTRRHVSRLTYRLGPLFLFEEPVSATTVTHMYKLGPSYVGSFQAPVVQDQFSSAALSPGTREPLSSLMAEDRILFGLIASHPSLKSLADLGKVYCSVDIATIARELSLAEDDAVTPVTLLHNSAFHLYGPARTLGAVLCGYSGLRSFEPQPLRSLLSSVGGASVVLGLVAMATTVDNLYASMKALVCIVGNNQTALKEMERTGGFQVLGMLLRSKARLINGNILHLTYTLVGTVNSEHESACIPNTIAFRDLLADLSVWASASEEIQRSLFAHFFDLLTHTSKRLDNARQMLSMRLVAVLVYRLHDSSISFRSVKSICNVLSALLACGPSNDDIQRIGQLLATTLPSNRECNENSINLYDEGEDSAHNEGLDHTQFGRFHGDEGRQRRAIVLRNMLLDVLLSLLANHQLEINTKFASQLYSSLGFDWLLLFMQAAIHIDTVVRALRILVQLLHDPQLSAKFHEGEIFGGWVQGFGGISEEMTKMIKDATTHFSPLIEFQKSNPQLPLSGAAVLANLLPHHAKWPQVYLLMAAILLGRTCMDIPFSATFDMETLDQIFGISNAEQWSHNAKINGEAAYVLLAVTRTLLHQEPTSPGSQHAAVNLIKFLGRVYQTFSPFASMAAGQEFIEALAGCLFPPALPGKRKDSELKEGGGGEGGRDEWIVVDTKDPLLGDTAVPALLQHEDSLAVCSLVKMIRTIAVDGFGSTTLSKENQYTCPVLERVLSASPLGASPAFQRHYQTLILHSIMDYLQSGNEDILVLFRSIGVAMERLINGLGVFCSRLVDKVWQGFYLKPTSGVYMFLHSLTEQARKIPKNLPLIELQRSLNRLILYQVSTIPTTDAEQKSLMDTLCLYSSQAHEIFSDTNVDSEFFECLIFRLLKIAFVEKELGGHGTSMGGASAVSHDTQLPQGYVPGSLAMMKSGANRLWIKMLEYKRRDLEVLLSMELPAPKSASREPTSLPVTSSLYLRLQNCEQLLNSNLARSWENFVAGERSTFAQDVAQKDGRKGGGLFRTGIRKRDKRTAGVSVDSLVLEYTQDLCPVLVLACQKHEESLLRKHQRNVEYRHRFTASEWRRLEHEVTRERGLWGPDGPSLLDKWMLDSAEGPCRMRKRTCSNSTFYQHYPYNPSLKNTTVIQTKYQRPASAHSRLQFERGRLFQRPTLLATPTVFPSDLHGNRDDNSSDDKAKMAAETTPTLQTLEKESQLPSPYHSSQRHNQFSLSDSDDPVAQTLYKMFEPDDKVDLQFQCGRLTGLDSKDGVLLLGNTHFYVIEGVTILSESGQIMDLETASEGSFKPVVPSHLQYSESARKEAIPITCIKWSYDTIREVHKRRYLLRHCALEVFSSDGRNHFLIFHVSERDRIHQRLLSLAKASLRENVTDFVAGTHPDANPEQTPGLFSVWTGEKALPERWANGEISNFQYLMHLNTLAGRSYNDLMQYPIFPWVLADYTSQTLDLTSPKTFRDFSLPMGAQNDSRLQRFIERFKYFEDPTGENTPPYYYGTHYSSAMIVASYLIRMEPFTQYFLKLQGGHFDLPDRLFHSIPDAWRSASESNMADIKELIPEFFYLPEFLSNTNHFDLGTKQSGERLNHVVLPPWAKGDPQEFIRAHREALESDYVSAHLHEWIDLIFGYKQTGKEALDAHNVFHHLFYEGAVDIDKIEDSVKRNAAISFIHNFGQMPKQLFKRPHRARKVLAPPTPVAMETTQATPTAVLDSRKVFYKNLVQLMPSKEPVKEVRGEVNQIVFVGDRHLAAVERNRVLLPPSFTRYFIWGFPDCSARIALVEGDRVTSVFEGLHQGRILCATLADEHTLLTGGDSTVVCVWEMKHSGPKERAKTQLQLKHTLHGHTSAVSCIATSTNYNLIISGSKDKSCILWDMYSFGFIRQLSGHNGPVAIVTINQLNGNIVSCTKNQVRLWTVNGTLLAETTLLITGSFRILCAAVSEIFDWDRENVIVTGSSDGIVRLWVLEYCNAEEEELVKAHKRRSKSAESGGMAETNLDRPDRQRAGTVVGRLRAATLSGKERRLRSRSSPAPLPSDEDDPFGTEDEFAPSPEDSDEDADSALLPPNASQEVVLDGQSQEVQTVAEAVGAVLRDKLKSTNGASSTAVASETGGNQLSVGNADSSHSVVNDLALSTLEKSITSGSSELSPEYRDSEPDNSRPQSENEDEPTQEHRSVRQSSNSQARSHDSEPGSHDNHVTLKEAEPTPTEAPRASASPTYDQMMAEARQKSEELRARAGRWTRKLSLVHMLTMHTSFSRQDNDTPAAVTSLCISKDHRKLFVGDARGRIFSWSVTDSIGGVMEHWLRDESVDKCMNCAVEFTFTERKHHCRNCGKIFCARCSSYEYVILRLGIFKPVRVCFDCYSKLTMERTEFLT